MANLPKEFREKFEKLERKFEVSTVIFKKYEEIFSDIFCKSSSGDNYQPKSKKPR